jgi:hypothetical protein
VNKIIARSEKPEMYSMFGVDYGLILRACKLHEGILLYSLILLTKTFHRTLYCVNKIYSDMMYWGGVIKAVVYLKLQYNEGLLYCPFLEVLKLARKVSLLCKKITCNRNTWNFLTSFLNVLK